MRLSPHERDEVCRTLYGADPNGRVWLFGSRADDSRRGGGIDIYLEASQPIDLKITSVLARIKLGMQIRWEGQGKEEKGYDSSGKCIVAVAPRYFRPTEVETLLGDPTKAKEKLGWTPKISFDELVAEMVREDLKVAERDELIKKHGYRAMDYHE